MIKGIVTQSLADCNCVIKRRATERLFQSLDNEYLLSRQGLKNGKGSARKEYEIGVANYELLKWYRRNGALRFS